MIGLHMPDHQRYSARVATVLGQNPGPFTGPGTNTYLVGTGHNPILLDTGQGVPVYSEKLTSALREHCADGKVSRIVLTHAHADHIGGVKQVRTLFGGIEVLKKPWPGKDQPGEPLTAIDDAAVVSGEGCTLRAVFTPGHAPDHLCYYLEEEQALFTGDMVLGAGTTVISDESGNLGEYMNSLRRLLELDSRTIYPAHGPVIHEADRKIREYIAHRELRERQILDILAEGPRQVGEIVRIIYTDVPEHLHAAAAMSVRSHLKKLRAEDRVEGDETFRRIN
jgi:glyoxylase-like metal-dependent hydrolase (beta-lactamase superfamily II)